MDIDARLERLETRQEALIASGRAIADTLENINATLAELAKWIEAPPSSDLPEVLKALVASIHTLVDRMDALPAAVARAVTTGEVRIR
jgi:hypothetical protein